MFIRSITRIFDATFLFMQSTRFYQVHIENTFSMTKDKDQLPKPESLIKTKQDEWGVEVKEGIPTMTLFHLLVVNEELKRGRNLRILRAL